MFMLIKLTQINELKYVCSFLRLLNSAQIFGRGSWNQISSPRTSAEDLQTSPEIQAQSPGRISRPSAESFRCTAGHLKFRYQTRCSNLLLHIDNINFFLRCQFKDQIWWNPRPDIWSQEPRLRIWGLVYKSRLKPWAGYQGPRPRVSDMRPDIWNSDIRQDVLISHGNSVIYQRLLKL